MARGRLTIGRKAVAIAVIGDLLEIAADRAQERVGKDPSVNDVATEIVAIAWDVEYKPNADKLVLTLDSSFEVPQGPDAMRSTPEDGGTVEIEDHGHNLG